MKIHFPILISLLVFLGACNQSNQWLTYKLDAPKAKNSKTKHLTSVNPKNKDFPGGRGENHLVVYTPEFGERTSTNEWGTEAIVDNGIVVSIGGNNSFIPENGLVISGNEAASVWINKNLEIGMELELKDNLIEYTVTENTNINQARRIFNKAQKRIKQNKDINADDQVFSNIQKQCETVFNEYLQEKENENIEGIRNCGLKLLNLAENYYYKTFPSVENEFRGAWIRLADHNPEQLKATIKRMADAGFNAILPETIYNGYAIYPNAHDLLPQLPQFEGWDPIQVLVDECKKYNMQVIPWCEIFFVGGSTSPMLKLKPEWIGMFRHGKPYAEWEPGFYYFCPSRPEVHKYLLEVLDNLASHYKIDGVQLDYIRYSLSEPWEKGYCYCNYCRDKVQHEHHFDIRKITPDDKQEWEIWNKYRENNITTFVKSTRELFNKKFPGLAISADVFPDPKQSLQKKFQNWKHWVEEGLLDDVYIMSYSPDTLTISTDSKSLVEITSGTKSTPIVGLGPYLGFRPDLLLEQIEISRNTGAKGVCLFSFNALTEKQIEALTLGPFRKN